MVNIGVSDDWPIRYALQIVIDEELMRESAIRAIRDETIVIISMYDPALVAKNIADTARLQCQRHSFLEKRDCMLLQIDAHSCNRN